MLEGINGLVFIADYRKMRVVGQQFNQSLLSFVKILILIHQHIGKLISVITSWIITQETQGLWHQFINQHSFVKH